MNPNDTIFRQLEAMVGRLEQKEDRVLVMTAMANIKSLQIRLDAALRFQPRRPAVGYKRNYQYPVEMES